MYSISSCMAATEDELAGNVYMNVLGVVFLELFPKFKSGLYASTQGIKAPCIQHVVSCPSIICPNAHR